MKQKLLLLASALFLFLPISHGQTGDIYLEQLKSLQSKIASNDHRYDILEKKIDDVLWFHRVGDIAFIDKVLILGPPAAKIKNPTAMGANNPLRFSSYVFIPKNIDVNKKYPLIVLVHGGVHADFGTYHVHIIRELMAQGYIVVAPEYRRRSPVWHVEKLQTPLLIHTNTNDDDVNVLEVETLIRALKAENKKFEYEIYKDIPGGHSFDRIDPKQSREIRLKIWAFLAKHLNPPKPLKTLKEMEKAAYVVIP